MTEGIRTVLYPVRDIDAARRLYGALVDGPPVMDEARYVGFEVDGGHVGLDPGGHGRGMTGPVAYWHVDDVHKRLAGLLEAGAELLQPVTDVGGGRLIATVGDPDGNVIGLLQP